MRRRSDRCRVSAAACLAVIVAALTGCSPAETDPAALRNQDGHPRYIDGIYAAAMSHADADGWRAWVQVTVRAGLVTGACFNAADGSGALLLSDASVALAYVERYRLATGVSLAEEIEALAARLIEHQDLPVSVEPDARDWSATWASLATAALQAATYGANVRSTGPATVTQPGPYVVADRPDRLGWSGELVVVYGAGEIAAASFRQIRVDGTGAVTVKDGDQAYARRWSEHGGLVPSDVSRALLGQLLEAQSSGVDGVAGATLTSDRFRALVREVEAARTRPALPARLCR